MDIWSIGAIILFGIFLVIADIFVLSGTLVAGVAGGILLVSGIFLSFTYFGAAIGTAVLISSILATFIVMFAANKYMSSHDFGLQDSIDSKVNEVDNLLVQKGDIGEAFGDLRLNGRARINGELFDVESTKSYIESGSDIRVVGIEGSKIMVEALTTEQTQLSSEQL